MNLLARILSHGFAFAVVALIILVLMYRGEFPAWELPESLAIKGLPRATEEADSGTVDRMSDAARLPAEAAAASPEPSEESLAPASASDATEETQSADDVPAADKEPSVESGTTPETAAETTGVAEPDEGIDTGAALDHHPVEADDEPSATAPLDYNDRAVQATDEVTAQLDDEATDENSTPAEAPQATATVDSSDDSADQTTEDTPVNTDDAAVDGSATTVGSAPATTDADSNDDSTVQASAETIIATDDTTVVETETKVETASETIDTDSDVDSTVQTPAGTTTSTDTAVAVETIPAVETAPITATEATTPAASDAPAAEPLAAPVTEDAPQTIAGATSETPYEVMAKAREAFWLRDFEQAEQQYRKLTQLDPDNPDGYGEMGNMYFSQGKWDESAAAYYEAGTRLLQDGLVQQARQMVDVIRGLNGAQADDLEAQIDAASASMP